MGGIIVTNAVGRAELTGLVDGAVSVCGAYHSHDASVALSTC